FTPPPSNTPSARCLSSTATIPLLLDLLDHPEVPRESVARDVAGRQPEVAVVRPVRPPGVAALEVQLPPDLPVADRDDGVAAERALVGLRHRDDPVGADVALERLVHGEPEGDGVPGGEHVLNTHFALRDPRVADRLVPERRPVRLGGRLPRELAHDIRPGGLGWRAELRDR